MFSNIIIPLKPCPREGGSDVFVCINPFQEVEIIKRIPNKKTYLSLLQYIDPQSYQRKFI